jgi:hypothetical protein
MTVNSTTTNQNFSCVFVRLVCLFVLLLDPGSGSFVGKPEFFYGAFQVPWRFQFPWYFHVPSCSQFPSWYFQAPS